MAGTRIASYRDRGGAELALARLRDHDVDTGRIEVVVVEPARRGRRRWTGRRGPTIPGRVDVVAHDGAVAPTAERVLAQWWDPAAAPVHVSEVRSKSSPSAFRTRMSWNKGRRKLKAKACMPVGSSCLISSFFTSPACSAGKS